MTGPGGGVGRDPLRPSARPIRPRWARSSRRLTQSRPLRRPPWRSQPRVCPLAEPGPAYIGSSTPAMRCFHAACSGLTSAPTQVQQGPGRFRRPAPRGRWGVPWHAGGRGDPITRR